MVSFETISELEFKTLISRVEGTVFLKSYIIYPIMGQKINILYVYETVKTLLKI